MYSFCTFNGGTDFIVFQTFRNEKIREEKRKQGRDALQYKIVWELHWIVFYGLLVYFLGNMPS